MYLQRDAAGRRERVVGAVVTDQPALPLLLKRQPEVRVAAAPLLRRRLGALTRAWAYIERFLLKGEQQGFT